MSNETTNAHVLPVSGEVTIELSTVEGGREAVVGTAGFPSVVEGLLAFADLREAGLAAAADFLSSADAVRAVFRSGVGGKASAEASASLPFGGLDLSAVGPHDVLSVSFSATGADGARQTRTLPLDYDPPVVEAMLVSTPWDGLLGMSGIDDIVEVEASVWANDGLDMRALAHASVSLAAIEGVRETASEMNAMAGVELVRLVPSFVNSLLGRDLAYSVWVGDKSLGWVRSCEPTGPGTEHERLHENLSVVRAALDALPLPKRTAWASLRRELGLTQADVARELGVSQSRVSEWENGVAKPSRQHAAAYVALGERVIRETM